MSSKRKFYVIAYNRDTESGITLSNQILGPFETQSDVKDCIENNLIDNEQVTHAEVVTVNRKYSFRSVRKVFEDEI